MRSNRLQWVLVSGISGFLIVLLASFAVNEAATSFMRAGIAFFLAAFIGLLFFYIWNWITIDLQPAVQSKKQPEKRENSETDRENDN